MPTGTVVCTNVLEKLGLCNPNGSAGSDDIAAVLRGLNTQWNAWSIDEGLIWGKQTYQAALSAGRAVYSIGPGGDFNTSRPQRIYKVFTLGTVAFTGTTTSASATITAIPDTSNLVLGQQVIGAGIPANSFIITIVTNTSATISNAATASATLTGTIYATNGNRNELKIVEAGQYYDHNDLGATAYTPDEIYADYLTSGATGTMNLYLFPVPRSAPLALELDMAVVFATWVLATNYNIPPGYQDSIEWALAFRMLSTFGVAVQPQVAEVVKMEGVKAEARIREMNARNRQIPAAAMQLAGSAPAPQQGA